MRITALVLTAFVLVTHAAECPEHCDCPDLKTVRCVCPSRMASLTIFDVESTAKAVHISNCGEVFVPGFFFSRLTMDQFEVKDCGKVVFSDDAFVGLKKINVVHLHGISNLTLGDMTGFNSDVLNITDSVIERFSKQEMYGSMGWYAVDQMKVTNCTLNRLQSYAFNMHPRHLFISESHIKSIGAYAFRAKRKPRTLSLRFNKIDKIEWSGLDVNGVDNVEMSGNIFTSMNSGGPRYEEFEVYNAENVSFVDNTVVFNHDVTPEFSSIRVRLNFSGNNFLGSVSNKMHLRDLPSEVIIKGNRYNCGCYLEWIWSKYESPSAAHTFIHADVVRMLLNTSSCSGPKELAGVQLKDVSKVVFKNGTCSRLILNDSLEVTPLPEVSINQPS